MSESAGGTVVKAPEVVEYQVQVHLKFESGDYSLPRLTERLQDVEALMKLLLRPKSTLSPPRKSAGILRRPRLGLVGRTFQTSRRTGDYIVSIRDGSSGRFYTKYFPTGTSNVRIQVESISLHSPLELVLLISGGAVMIGRFVKLLPLIIQAKNDWNESRVRRAESNVALERLNLESAVLKVITSEVEEINLDGYASLKDDHPSKKVVKGAIRALSNLDKAEVRE